MSSHKSNDFGSGCIDALAAVNAIGDEGINEIDDAGIVIYPNPASDVLYINHGISDYKIINILGETLVSGEIIYDNQQIDISNLSNGVYFIKINDFTKKIIVNR